jgi:hypothetical protein
VTGLQLLQAPVAVESIWGCDHLFSNQNLNEESEDGDGSDAAVWYIAASICIAAEATLCLSEDLPPSAAALAVHIALSPTFLAALCHASACAFSPKSTYINAAASPAFKVIDAAAFSALAALPPDAHHPWTFGTHSFEQVFSTSGHTMKQLLLLAREKIKHLV